jgi:hypothetical protein
MGCIFAGTVAEYDAPAQLLENKNSLFAKLVTEYTMCSMNGTSSNLPSEEAVQVVASTKQDSLETFFLLLFTAKAFLNCMDMKKTFDMNQHMILDLLHPTFLEINLG